MSEPYKPTEKNRRIVCNRCGHEHNYFDRAYSAPDGNGLKYSVCPANCGSMQFTDKRPPEPEGGAV